MESIGCSLSSLSLAQFRAKSFSVQELLFGSYRRPPSPILHASVAQSFPELRRSTSLAANGTLMANSVPSRSGVYTVGDFMTRKEELHVVKPTTSVDEALEILVEKRITGFPVIDDNWKLVGVVSDYDLLALDSISGGGRTDTSMFPEVDSSWKTFNEVQRLLSKTNGKVVGDLMTTAPLVVREITDLEDVARLLLQTKYRRLPVVDADGKLVGIITRGNVVRAALQIKRAEENRT
ncbi:CBS domain-containing protein CBSX1, chloroplastic-like [Benincasa hispida]|uniref:CBS domain-containing protein CBSX1, chloroplastic-like n=1 Tax=Benincasa hispida TaxID=102211 RepID=UPI0019013EB1|nr:CBS domain-containing protein CBSX1, chloroplastic-like [Benincasa hispida]